MRFGFRSALPIAFIVLATTLVAVPATTSGAAPGGLSVPSLLYPDTPVATISNVNGVAPSEGPALRAVATLPGSSATVSLRVEWRQQGPNAISAFMTDENFTTDNGAVAQYMPTLRYVVTTPNCSGAYCLRGSASTTGAYTAQWLGQLLSAAHYLSVTFSPSRAPDAVPAYPQPGTFSPRFTHIYPQLFGLWNTYSYNKILQGAVLRFLDEHALPTSRVPTLAFYEALMKMVNSGQVTTRPYSWVYVSTTTRPQILTLWVDGVAKFRTQINSGMPAAPTALRTDPVYQRLATTTMSGTNPDGTKYHDTGIPWVSYFYGGEALHGFIRSSYGTPQSLGCIEMRFADAKTVWPWTPIGTLVTIQ